MAENNKLDPQNAVFSGEESGSPQPVKPAISAQSVYPFLEDADTLALQAQSETMGKPKPPPKPQPVEASMASSPGPFGVFLLIVLGLVLIALVSASAYLLIVDPGRLLEIVNRISSLFAR